MTHEELINVFRHIVKKCDMLINNKHYEADNYTQKSACALLVSRDKIYDVFIEEDYVEAKVLCTKYAQIKDFEKELKNTPFLKSRPVMVECVGKRKGFYFFRIS